MRGVLVPADRIQFRDAEVTETDVVDQDVDDIRRLAAITLTKIRELLIDRTVVSSPLIGVLLLAGYKIPYRE